MHLKRTIKRAAGQASAALAPFVSKAARPAACILVYHRIADIALLDPRLDNWNVPPAVFEQHMAALSTSAECIRLEQLPARVAAPEPATPARPIVCVTFDDGFASVCTQALPILQRYGVPATTFVVTRFVGSREPMPFDRWSRQNATRVSAEEWRPLTWAELDTCIASGLMTIGGHSHEHLDGRLCTAAQLAEEAGRSRAILRDRLGRDHAACYAYPYGSRRLGEVPAAYVAAVRAAGYELAVSTDLGLATAESDRFVLPRVEASAVDSPAVLKAKVRGSLVPFHLTDLLRRADRSA